MASAWLAGSAPHGAHRPRSGLIDLSTHLWRCPIRLARLLLATLPHIYASRSSPSSLRSPPPRLRLLLLPGGLCAVSITFELNSTCSIAMASMTAVGAVAAIPAGLRTDLETSLRASPAPSTVFVGQRKAAAVLSRRSVVARASASEQEGQFWNAAKNAAAAAAISLALSASPVQAKEGNAFLKFPDNTAGEASRQILGGAKKKGDDSFAEGQKTGKETTGQAASAGDAQPAISQVDPNAPESSDSIGDSIAARADAAAYLAPGTGQQNGKKGVNPIEKAFATPTRGLGDKEGENEARAGNLLAKKDDLPGNDQTYRQNTGISESIYKAFKSAGEGRDAGVGIKPQ